MYTSRVIEFNVQLVLSQSVQHTVIWKYTFILNILVFLTRKFLLSEECSYLTFVLNKGKNKTINTKIQEFLVGWKLQDLLGCQQSKFSFLVKRANEICEM